MLRADGKLPYRRDHIGLPLGILVSLKSRRHSTHQLTVFVYVQLIYILFQVLIFACMRVYTIWFITKIA